MAMDGKFFRPFARIAPQLRTPWVSIFFLGGLGLAILLIFADADKIDKLLTSVVLVDCVFFALTGLAIFRLRESKGSADSYRSPLFPLFPVIFVVGETLILVMAFLNPKYVSGIWLVVAWIAIAFACYAVFFQGRSSLRSGQK
jgi:amino acid transporter